ncbi:FecR family protein [Thalassospira mesophila]|uniref:FecR family protein n=1 Tax=Thalassospira mesophila TaxID=1293891 RepID=UPI0013020E3A|nr:FecR family protein [Thalassospira mesophila]
MIPSIVPDRPAFISHPRRKAWLPCAGIAAFLMITTALSAQPAFARGEQAGVSAAVRGEVELAESKGVVGSLVESGQPIYLGDYITSSPGSGMQILLLDETVFTIGPNSEIAIDDFVYDPANNQGHMTASITRGVVRVLTGKLAHDDPKTMKINLPVGSIGIRGTQFLVSVQDGPGNGGSGGNGGGNSWSPSTQKFAQQQLGSSGSGGNTGPVVGVINLGPGSGRNDSGSHPGAVELTSLNGVTQPLSNEGFGAFITSDTVTPPTRFPADLAGLDMSSLVTRPTPKDAKANGSGSQSGGGNGNGGSKSSGSTTTGSSGSQSSSASASGTTKPAASASSSGTGSGSTAASGTPAATSNNSQSTPLSGTVMTAASSDTGQSVASVLDVAITQTSVTSQTSETSNETAETNNDVHSNPDVTTDVPDEIVDATTYKAMSEISTGFYDGSRFVSTENLSYNSYTSVDFGAREIFTEIFNITDSKGQDGYLSAHKYYTDSSDYAVITNDDLQAIPDSNCIAMGCNGKVTFTTPTVVHVELSTTAAPDGADATYGLNNFDPGPIDAPPVDIPDCQDCGGGDYPPDTDPGDAPPVDIPVQNP